MSDLVAPGVPELRKAVNTDNQRTIAGDSDVEFNGSIFNLDEIQDMPLAGSSCSGKQLRHFGYGCGGSVLQSLEHRDLFGVLGFDPGGRRKKGIQSRTKQPFLYLRLASPGHA